MVIRFFWSRVTHVQKKLIIYRVSLLAKTRACCCIEFFSAVKSEFFIASGHMMRLFAPVNTRLSCLC